MTGTRALTWALGALLGAALMAAPARAVPIEIVYDDLAGQGFLDPAVGEQRRVALAAAVDQWAKTLAGTVPVVIAANMVPLGGTGTNALLASAGAITVHRNFTGAHPQTWYAAALANQLSVGDVNGPLLAEIAITFNADVDGPEVLGSVGWYYGIDAQPGVDIDFVTIALHEIGHGLGFLDTIDASSGTWRLDDQPSILERMLSRPEIGALTEMLPAERMAAIVAPGDLLWSGPGVVGFTGSPLAVYAPDPFQQGSSIAHWDNGSGELMQPFYVQATHDLGALLPALADMGWDVAGGTPTPRQALATPTSTRPPRPSPTPGTPVARRDMIYVTNFDDGTVSVIDAATRAVVQTVVVDDGPIGIAASSDGTRVYVAGFQAGTLTVLRTGDNRVIASVPVGESPNSVAATRDGAFVVVTDTAADRATIIAADTLEVVDRVPAGRQPSGIALDGAGRRAFISNFSGATVTVVDLDARRRRAIVPLSFATPSDGLIGIAIAPATGLGYVTSFFNGWARPIDADSLFTAPLVFPFSNVVSRLDAVAADASGALAYFAGHDVDTGTGRVSVMRIEDNEVLAVLVVGKVPEALTLTSDETLLYVANAGSNDVSAVDTVLRMVVGTVPVGHAPMGIVAAAVPAGQCLEDCETPTVPSSTATSTPVSSATSTVTQTPTVSPIVCAGDCDGNGRVGVNELVTAVGVALNQKSITECRAADLDSDGTVSVADLIRSVSRSLVGCGM